MARGVYSGKVSEWSTSSRKSKSRALIGLVPEPSHNLRIGVRGWTGADGTRGTYTSLTRGGGVRRPLGSRRWDRNEPNVLSIFNRDQTTRVLSTVQNLLLVFRVTNQVDDFNQRMVLPYLRMILEPKEMTSREVSHETALRLSRQGILCHQHPKGILLGLRSLTDEDFQDQPI